MRLIFSLRSALALISGREMCFESDLAPESVTANVAMITDQMWWARKSLNPVAALKTVSRYAGSVSPQGFNVWRTLLLGSSALGPRAHVLVARSTSEGSLLKVTIVCYPAWILAVMVAIGGPWALSRLCELNDALRMSAMIVPISWLVIWLAYKWQVKLLLDGLVYTLKLRPQFNNGGQCDDSKRYSHSQPN